MRQQLESVGMDEEIDFGGLQVFVEKQLEQRIVCWRIILNYGREKENKYIMMRMRPEMQTMKKAAMDQMLCKEL